MSENVREKEQFDVCLPGLLDEVLSNESCSILFIPINITKRILAELAGVAIEIDDARLHRMMLRLGLYDCDYRERTKKKAEMEAEILDSRDAGNERERLRGLMKRSLEFVAELVAERKDEYKCWKGRELAGHARSLKADIDEGEAIFAEAREVLGEEVGMGCAGAVTKTVYRVESEDGKLGLWRDADGTWNPKFHLLRDGKCKDMPMEDSEVYREGGKRWFASAPSRELLKEWFSLEDLCDLKKHGFGIYEFEVSQWKLVSEFECIFPRDAVVGRKEIGISEIYEEAEDGNS